MNLNECKGGISQFPYFMIHKNCEDHTQSERVIKSLNVCKWENKSGERK